MKRKLLCAVAATIGIGALWIGPATAQSSFLGENFSCETAEADLARAINNNQVPDSAGLIRQMQHLMWMLQSGIRWLDGNCTSEPGYSQVRASWENSYRGTENACKGMASSPGLCSPQP
jgi:hypothetical protein